MPLYEYYCAECQQTFEILVTKYDSPPNPCPNCGSDRVSKQMSVGAFRIDGIFSNPTPDKKEKP